MEGKTEYLTQLGYILILLIKRYFRTFILIAQVKNAHLMKTSHFNPLDSTHFNFSV